VPLGLISGYFGGWIDRILVLINDSLIAFPYLLLAIVIAFLLQGSIGGGVATAAIAITVIYIPQYFRVVRNSVLSVREEPYVEAGRVIGARPRTVITRYVFANVVQSVPVLASLNAADAILTLAALSFLGIGIDPSAAAEWGYDISRGIDDAQAGYWWTGLFPGLAIILLVAGLTLVGESLNDTINPVLRQRRFGRLAPPETPPVTSLAAELPMTPVIRVRDLRVWYASDRGPVQAVDGVSFDVRATEIVGLIGPNGAGKTSLVDALTGYVRPARGHVRFSGADVTGHAAHRLAREGLARTFQSVELFHDLTVSENLLVAAERPALLKALLQVLTPARPAGQEAVDWAVGVTEIADIMDRSPRELSHGQRKLVGVARALACRPSLLLLDEPAAGLDTEETTLLGRRLRSLPGHGITLLLIDHDMGLVLEVCDHVLVIDFGKLIAQGTPAQIRVDSKVIDAYLGRQGGASEQS
jgi:peptide/nickel transport system permease protein